MIKLCRVSDGVAFNPRKGIFFALFSRNSHGIFTVLFDVLTVFQRYLGGIMAKASQYGQQFGKELQQDAGEEIEHLPTIRIAEDPDAFESVNSMLDELREGGEYAELSVFGRPKSQPGQPAQRGNAFLMVCGANDYTLAELMSLIQESWGEGLYTIKGKRGGKYAGQKTIPIGPAPAKPGQVQTALQPAPVDTTKQLAEMFEKIARQQTEAMGAMFGSILNKLDRPTVDPMALQRDTIAMLGSMREVFAPQQQALQAPVSATSSFSQLRELLELKKLLVSEEVGGGETNPLMNMAEKFLPALMASAQASQANQAAQPVKQLPPSTKNVNQPKPAQPLNVQESPAMLKMMNTLRTLVDAAKRDADVDLYAEIALDQLGLDQVKTFISTEDGLDRLCLFSADVKNHRAWFEKLRATIVQWLAEAENEIDTDDNAPEQVDEVPENKNDDPINGNSVG